MAPHIQGKSRQGSLSPGLSGVSGSIRPYNPWPTGRPTTAGPGPSDGFGQIIGRIPVGPTGGFGQILPKISGGFKSPREYGPVTSPSPYSPAPSPSGPAPSGVAPGSPYGQDSPIYGGPASGPGGGWTTTPMGPNPGNSLFGPFPRRQQPGSSPFTLLGR